MTHSRPLGRQHGSVTLVFLFSIVSITLSLLAAIDVMRYNLVQSRLQNALDAAVLAAGRNLGNLSDTPSQPDQAAWKQDALGYLRANMPDNYLGSSYDIGQVTVTVNGDARTGQQIGMHATARLPLLVAGFLATKELPMAAGNTATRRSRSDLELVMVLDNTGSMQWVDKSNTVGTPNRLDALKDAANTLVDTLFDENIPNSNFSIGLVPFATTVNPRDINGNKMTRVLKNGSATPFSTSSWDGCLQEPRNAGGTQPAPPKVLVPSDRPFSAYFNLDDASSFEWYQYWWSYWNWEWRQRKTTYRYVLNNNGCIPTTTTFLTSSRKTIKQGISNMVPEGGTIIPAGTLWGWRMLSPAWRGSNGWGSPTLPQDKSSYLTKAMIIMTDGENGVLHNRANARFTQYGAPDMSRLRYQPPYYTANYADGEAFDADDGSANLPPYGRLYATPDTQDATNATSLATLNRLLVATCAAAKADGIKIWTITFSYGAKNPETQNTMRSCASEAYYHAPTNADLQTIFKNIAGQLSELRLVK